VNVAPLELLSERPEDPEQAAPECRPKSQLFSRRPQQRRRQQQVPELCEIGEVSLRLSGATSDCVQVSDMQSPMSNSVVASMPTRPTDSPAKSPTQVAAALPLRRVVARAEVAWEGEAQRPPQDRRPPRRQRAEQSPGVGSPSRTRLRRHVRESPKGLHSECPEHAVPTTGQVGTGGEALTNVDISPTTSKAMRPGTSHAIDVLVLPSGQVSLGGRAEDVYNAWEDSPTDRHINRRESRQDLLPGRVETEHPHGAGAPSLSRVIEDGRLRTTARVLTTPVGDQQDGRLRTAARALATPLGGQQACPWEDGRLRAASQALVSQNGDANLRALHRTGMSRLGREPAAQAMAEAQGTWARRRELGGPSPSRVREDGGLWTGTQASPSRNGQGLAGRQDGPLNRHRQLQLQGGTLQTAGQLIVDL